ncbi:MAG TPA: hypothetical protein VE861_12595 [Gemmatimonadaceae bacterium]|nr:hypothetical protein [Gemmatimonadaceae bacterium]
MKVESFSPDDQMSTNRQPARPLRAFAAATLLTLAAVACKKTVETEPVKSLTLVSGGNQVRQASRTLRSPLVFRAIDANGAGVGGVAITIVVVQGGGSVDSASVRTDANGEARVRWTLGPEVVQAVLATVPEIEPMRVTATGILPSDIVIAQGNNQSARVSVALANNIVVRVLGGSNVPMDSVNVTFQITGGGGAITPQSILTNASGEATVKWTVGPVAGANTALVRAATIDPVTINATATP